MIFADKLIELRKKNNWSQEELAEKLNVSRQTVSKWEGAQSVPDFNRVIEISELFGVTTDYLLKDNIESTEPITYPIFNPNEKTDKNIYSVSIEEANKFMQARDNASRKISLGVMMCIISPIFLILLQSLYDINRIKLTEDQTSGFGLIALILLIGVAVAIFIIEGLHLKPYEYLEYEFIETAYGVDGIVNEYREKYKPTHTKILTTGITLCVLSPLPIFLSMALGGEDLYYALSICVLLLMVGIGVMMIIQCNIMYDTFAILSETGNYSRANKKENKRNQNISAIYWGSTTAIYLAYSFITANWNLSWIVWPVAGVLYGVLTSILRMIRKEI